MPTQFTMSRQDDVDFVRYMAENFSAFEYKTQEEVLTIISFLTLVLSTAGMQLVDILSPSNLLTQLRGHTHNAVIHVGLPYFDFTLLIFVNRILLCLMRPWILSVNN